MSDLILHKVGCDWLVSYDFECPRRPPVSVALTAKLTRIRMYPSKMSGRD